MRLSYKPIGTCAKQIDIEIEDGLIANADFIGGCAGNTTAVAVLVKGMAVDEAVRASRGSPVRATPRARISWHGRWRWRVLD